jgi:amidohydrolase
MKCRVLAAAIGVGAALLLETPAAPAFGASTISAQANALGPKLVELRRDFHEHPELANREERTSRLVAEHLRRLGLDEVKTNVATYGVIGLLRGGHPGPVVAVRADMDALPIAETNRVSYQSRLPGLMHACGHDAHTAIALGVAEVLSQRREQVHGSVKFLFQPAEEAQPGVEPDGAQAMIRAGALENPRPIAILGLHTSPELETGRIGYRSGPAQAGIDTFAITIRGKAAPATSPELGVDTIVVASECVGALQTIKSRRLDPFAPALLTIGSISGGERPFSPPAEVKPQGSVRSFTEATRKQIEQLTRETLNGITLAHGATYDLVFTPVTAPVLNDPKLVEDSLPSLRRALGAANVVEVPQRMGGEDFSYYQQIVPGVLFRLGSGNRAKGISADAHTPAFDIDEDCLPVGVNAMASLVVDLLNGSASH